VQILQHDEEGLLLAFPEEKSPNGLADLQAPLGRIELGPVRVLNRNVQGSEERHRMLREARVQRDQPVGDLFPDRRRVVPVVHLEVDLQEPAQGQIRRRRRIGESAGLEHAPPRELGRTSDFPHQSRLADARLADERRELAMPLLGAKQGGDDRLVLLPAPHEARQAPRGGGVEAETRGRHAGELEDLDGLGHAPDGHVSERVGLEKALGETNGAGRAQRGPGLGELFQPRRQIGGLPDRRVVHVEIGSDGPYEHVTGVQADADLERDAVAPLDLVSVPRDVVEHAEGRVPRAEGVVLEGERRPEERHDAVAKYLIDDAFVGVDGFHHQLDDGIEQASGVFGIAVHQELHRALDVGEQHGNLLALALHRAARGEDTIGQVMRRVAASRAKAGRGARERGGGMERRPAHVAKAVLGSALRPADGAGSAQDRAAVAAERRGGAVVSAAAGTDHGGHAADRPGGPGRPAKFRPAYFPGAL
jgi:hypothetical protein